MNYLKDGYLWHENSEIPEKNALILFITKSGNAVTGSFTERLTNGWFTVVNSSVAFSVTDSVEQWAYVADIMMFE